MSADSMESKSHLTLLTFIDVLADFFEGRKGFVVSLGAFEQHTIPMSDFSTLHGGTDITSAITYARNILARTFQTRYV